MIINMILQASTQNQWSKEEIKEMKDKLAKKDKELSTTRDEVQQYQRKCQVRHGDC